MSNTCIICGSPFTVTDGQRELIQATAPVIAGERIDIPDPTLCPDCRFQRRLAHHNEHNLYKRKCDKTGKDIVSIVSPDKPYVVYDVEEWWKDDWDPMQYGRDFNFDRPFFEQFAELMKVVPRMSVMQSMNENSLYTSCVSHLKDCYMLFTSDHSRDCNYGVWVQTCNDCTDNHLLDQCELCYECLFSDHLYNCTYVHLSSNCRDSAFLFDCQGCSNCFLCSNLRNKQYHIANKEYSKEEYEEKMKEFPMSSHSNLEAMRARFDEVIKDAIHLRMWRRGRINDSTGDLLEDCENCKDCFELTRGKDCQFTLGFEVKNTIDCTYANGEVGYEMCECFPMPFQSAFNLNSYIGANMYYCDLCMNNCQNCFGCIGLKHKEYYILNKQYTREEYEELVPRIIKHMRNTPYVESGPETGPGPEKSSDPSPDPIPATEWGNLFPIELSIFTYNESQAQDYYPREEKTKDTMSYVPATTQVADDISNVPDTITDEVLACESCKRNYKIIAQELRFYRERNLPIPRKCFECRLFKRKSYKNPRKLCTRDCSKCGKEMETTYGSERKEKVYCEECYLKEVY